MKVSKELVLFEEAVPKPTNFIEISQEDFSTLCICALRYCQGRRTYMPSLVQFIVKTHFSDLSDNALKVIATDQEFQIEWGDACDRKDWIDFYKALEEFRNESDV